MEIKFISDWRISQKNTQSMRITPLPAFSVSPEKRDRLLLNFVVFFDVAVLMKKM